MRVLSITAPTVYVENPWRTCRLNLAGEMEPPSTTLPPGCLCQAPTCLSAASMTVDHPPQDEAGSESGERAAPELEGHESARLVCIVKAARSSTAAMSAAVSSGLVGS